MLLEGCSPADLSKTSEYCSILVHSIALLSVSILIRFEPVTWTVNAMWLITNYSDWLLVPTSSLWLSWTVLSKGWGKIRFHSKNLQLLWIYRLEFIVWHHTLTGTGKNKAFLICPLVIVTRFVLSTNVLKPGTHYTTVRKIMSVIWSSPRI